MIKLFRKTRQNLIMENPTSAKATTGKKTGKYFKYAIGEIVLVVIGILIALQINNWNEHRKQLNIQNAIYRIIKEDLLNDISKIDAFAIKYDSIKKPGFDALLTKKLTLKDFEQNPSYLSIMFGYKDISISQRGFNLLNSQSNLPNIATQHLPSKINKFYDDHIVKLEIAIKELGGELSNNLKKFKNYDWFSSLFVNGFNNEEYIEYLSNDPNAKNNIALYYAFYIYYVSELKRFKTDAEILITDIDNYLKEKQ